MPCREPKIGCVSVEDIVAKIYRNEPGTNLTVIHFEAKQGDYEDVPDTVESQIKLGLEKLGIQKLYSHQAQAIKAVLGGKHVVVATPTASGKTLCYNVPVLSTMAEDPAARALYLFPTKALSSDQQAGLREMIEACNLPLKMHTYDGDTAVSTRKILRIEGSVILTNPDMLHTAILPHHTKWVHLFENLRYVVIDELHQYRGVFGSHMANLVRRLRRICEFYGSNPVFIMSSATIQNPGELAERILEDKVEVVTKDGAPSGDKYFVIYNPPIVDRQLGLRKSTIFESKRFASQLVKSGIQTIVFAKARTTVENILKLLKDDALKSGIDPDAIRGYRGGYLPLERREIERGLREGKVMCVVSTNALELGIDIGRLEASVITGYPGTIASLRQQAGRAGRKQQTSLAIMVLSGNPVDQYIAQNPQFILQSSPEAGLVNPDNLYIMVSHIKCAAFELPFLDGQTFGKTDVTSVLKFLEQNQVVSHDDGKWYWMTESYPADEISLRNATEGNVAIIDTTNTPEVRTIGEIDLFSAPMLVHDQAIYIHGGVSYHVDKLDFGERKAFVRKVNVDWYTDANLEVNIKVLDESAANEEKGSSTGFGETSVTAITTVFKKIQMNTHQNLGYGEVHLPEMPMDTMSWWLTFAQPIVSQFSTHNLENALKGLGNLLIGILPLPLMCDPRDLGVHVEVKSPHFGRPAIFIFETSAGGVGLAEHIFGLGDQALRTAYDTLAKCACEYGCPGCVGPPGEAEMGSKEQTKKLLEALLT